MNVNICLYKSIQIYKYEPLNIYIHKPILKYKYVHIYVNMFMFKYIKYMSTYIQLCNYIYINKLI